MIRIFIRLIAPHWKLAVLALFFGVFTIAANVGLLATSAYLICQAALQPPVLLLMVPIVGVRFFGISRAVSRYAERYFSHDVTFRILARIRVSVYKVVEPLAPARLMDYRSGDLLSRIVADVETLQFVFLRVLTPPLIALITLVIWALILATFDPALSAVYALCFLIAGAAIPLLVKRLGQGVGERTVKVKAELSEFIVENMQGMTEIYCYGMADQQTARLNELNARLRSLQRQASVLSALSSGLNGMMSNLCMVLVIAAAVPLVADGAIPGVYLAMLGLGTLSTFEATLPLPLAFHNYDQSKASAERLQELAELRPATSDPARPALKPTRFDLSIRGLSFRYSEDSWVLKDFDLQVPEGGRIAVVGPSGVGKSSLVNVLLRFWDYEQGSIQIGGVEIKDLAEDDLRSLIGVVTQRTDLFNATIRENLLLAKPEASEEELIRAAQLAQLDEFIRTLPDGYDTYIGQDGFKLSGGQRQRLAIARVFLKDAPILILDEATKGLDRETERQVLAQIEQLMAGRTTLIITHDLEQLNNVDRIVSLSF